MVIFVVFIWLRW